jgi:hypothetical protein
LVTIFYPSVESSDTSLGDDKQGILEFLNARPGEYIAGELIAKRADGEHRHLTEPNWTQYPLYQLLLLGLIETDNAGRYRVKIHRPLIRGGRRFIAPHLQEILAKSGKNFANSSYAP